MTDFRTNLLAVAIVATLFTGQSRAQLWQVDFQGDSTHNGTFGQTDPVDATGPDTWNIVNVQALDVPGAGATEGPVVSAFPLVDSTGSAGSVTLSVGNVSNFIFGWSGSAGQAGDAVRGDYLLNLGAGGDTFFEFSGPSSPLDFSIDGLTPGEEYTLNFFHGNAGNADRGLTFDIGGNTATVVGQNGEASLTVNADGTGAISGTASLPMIGGATAAEGNWAGLTISTLATPLIFADVNSLTGEVVLKTPVEFANNVIGYEFRSAPTVGGLDGTGWTSIAENYDAGSPGPDQVDPDDDWVELPTSSTSVAEAQLTDPTGDGAQFGAGMELSLGSIWVPTPLGGNDLQMEILLEGGERQAIPVWYDTVGADNPLLLGDYNGNGEVDAGDWPTVRDNAYADLSALPPAQSYAFGDLNGDSANDALDFFIFRDLFVADQGPAALSQLTGATVPEPSAYVLLGLATAVFFVGARCRRRQGTRQPSSPAVRRGKRMGAGLVALAVLSGLTSEAQAQLWQVDFQGNELHNGLFGQTGPIDTVGPGTWNIFEVQAINSRPSVEGEPSDITTGSLSLPLLDATGGAGPVVLEVESAGGFLSGWAGGGGDSLTDDYLLALLPGGDDFFGYPGASSPLNFSITGLAPNTAYDLTFFHGTVAANRGLDFVANGVTTSVATGIEGVPLESTVSVTTDGTGAIAGSGGFIDGSTEGDWAGLTIASNLDPVTLEITRGTGTARLLNPSGIPVDLNYYEVQSTTDVLDPNWTGLRSNPNVDNGDGSGNGWELHGGTNVSSSILAESYLQGSTTFEFDGTPLDLGSLYDGSGQADEDGIIFSFGTAGATALTPGLVVFVEGPDGIVGDYNGDGIVDAADYTVWRDNLGGDASAFAPDSRDPGATGPVGSDDYDAWRANFGNTAGALDASGATVPEPAAGLMMLAAGAFVALARRHGVHNKAPQC